MPDSKPLALRIPEPGCRPGDQPDFSDFVIPRAGEARRPEFDGPASEMRDMAFSIIRVINKKGEAFLIGANIAPYPLAADGMQHDPTRRRKLLLHRRQIHQLEVHLNQKGKTLIPLAIFFKGGWAKCELGVAEGKKKYDKRDAIKKRQQQRDIAREMRRR